MEDVHIYQIDPYAHCEQMYHEHNTSYYPAIVTEFGGNPEYTLGLIDFFPDYIDNIPQSVWRWHIEDSSKILLSLPLEDQANIVYSAVYDAKYFDPKFLGEIYGYAALQPLLDKEDHRVSEVLKNIYEDNVNFWTANLNSIDENLLKSLPFIKQDITEALIKNNKLNDFLHVYEDSFVTSLKVFENLDLVDSKYQNIYAIQCVARAIPVDPSSKLHLSEDVIEYLIEENSADQRIKLGCIYQSLDRNSQEYILRRYKKNTDDFIFLPKNSSNVEEFVL